MKHEMPTSIRRAALAGTVALCLAALSAGVHAGGDPGNGSSICCGNGPPNIARYGEGMRVTPVDATGEDVQFENDLFGKTLVGVNYFVFVPDAGVVARSYKKSDGTNGNLISYTNPKGYHGIVFLVQADYTLVLGWPVADPVAYSTRPLGKGE